MFPKKDNKEFLRNLKRIKIQNDPKNIFNPGKIVSSRIPRFFPVISWSVAVRIGFPIVGFLYHFVPKQIR